MITAILEAKLVMCNFDGFFGRRLEKIPVQQIHAIVVGVGCLRIPIGERKGVGDV
jgi:hypothetical protein